MTAPVAPVTPSHPAAQYAICGRQPASVVRPESPEATAAAIVAAADAGRAVVAWGAGTKQRFGNPPRSYDVALDLTALDAVLEYEPADLVVTAQAGIPLHTLQQRLAPAGQFLALDPPYGARATLGGTLATNVSGPSRLYYGTARDLVLGLRVATPEGQLVRSGGKVVKNVVGYDLNKLHIGALGTAGVIVEVTLKVHPLPEAEGTAIASFDTLPAAHAAAGKIVRSPLYPRAVDLVTGLSSPAARGAWQVLVWASGPPAAVERQLRDATQWCRDGGAGGVERLDGSAHQDLWQRVVEFGRSPDGALLKLTCLPSQTADLLAAVGAGASVPAVARAGNGVVYVRLQEPDVAGIRRLVTAARAAGGNAVLEEAPDAVKVEIDSWDADGGAAQRRSDLDLMRAIKAQFDPNSVLSPGRFVAGI